MRKDMHIFDRGQDIAQKLSDLWVVEAADSIVIVEIFIPKSGSVFRKLETVRVKSKLFLAGPGIFHADCMLGVDMISLWPREAG